MCAGLRTNWPRLRDSLRRHDRLLAGVALLALLLALKSPILDQPYYWDAMAGVIPHADALYDANLWPFAPLGHDVPDTGHPPFYPETLAIAWKLLGQSLLVSHSVGLLFAFLALQYTYLLAKEVTGSIWAGMLAAVLTLLTPLFFAQSGTLNFSVPSTALLVMSVYYVRRSGWRFCVVASLLALTKLYDFVLVGIIVVSYLVMFEIWDPIGSGKRADLRKTLRVALPRCVPLGVWLVWYVLHHSLMGTWWGEMHPFKRGIQGLQPTVPALVRSLRKVVLQYLWEGHEWIPISSLCALVTIRIDPKQLRARRELLQTGLIACLTIVFLSLSRYYLARYLLPLYPLLGILGALSVLTLLRKKGNVVPRVVAVGLVVLCVTTFVNQYGGFGREYGDYETTMQYAEVVLTHQLACDYLAEEHPEARILAGWPISSELQDPLLGYVHKPLTVVQPGEEFDVLVFTRQGKRAENEPLLAIVQQRGLTLEKRFLRRGKAVDIYSEAQEEAAP